ncbi:hypothetical protein CkaCkLH20_09619 [Colletotrichum karsti]|uniref:Uncharacterized protein n=1 Tax=Colletotrichum karsti TaxID=1095194 RepID=A0A9P6I0R3_9PEZI|nr:uncharacterized protein CkaCkLH20_09619 [Colletotrichum karsti]KAF9872756.1 hypothetical protein CkaCkLH20_09619 [Colletotrichum karsti]
MLGPLGGPDPNSPPQSPTSASSRPMHHRKKYAARYLPPYHNINRPVLLEESGIQPTGNGHQFSFTPSNRFAQLSPRTSSEESDDEEESESDSEPPQKQLPQARPHVVDEDVDSDDEEDSDDSEEDSEDEDDDMDMMPPSAPLPPCIQAAMGAPMPPSMQPSIHPSMHPSIHPRMAVDSSSEEDSDDAEEEEGRDDEEGDDEDDEESDSDSDSSDSDSDPEILPQTQEPRPAPVPAAVAAPGAKANFTLEELSDFDPMDQDRTGTIAPSGFSSPASARSRSRAPAPPPELPHGLTRDMRNLNCSASDSDSSSDIDTTDADHKAFLHTQRALRLRKRLSHGSSIGKRTISERSDSDHEDWTPLDPDAVGSSARRLRRKVGDPSVRRSFIQLHFQDPPPERIDEVDEPDSEVEGVYYCDHETLAKELPYWMEYESPSP